MLRYGVPDAPDQPIRKWNYVTVRGTHDQAKAELARRIEQLKAGTHVDPQKLTVEQWIDTWTRDYAQPTVSAKTFERYSELLRLHVVPYLGGTLIQKLIGGEIQRLYTKLRTQGRRPKNEGDTLEGLAEQTILHVHRVFSQCLSEAARQRIIARSPADDVKAPRPAAGQAADGEEGAGEAIKALEREQLVTLLQGLRGEWLFPIAAVAAGSGARRGEILALRWSDVDFSGGSIRIERSVEETNGKGKDGRNIRFKAPKNPSSRRKIGIDGGLVGLLRGHKARQGEMALKLGTHPTGDWLLFPNAPDLPTEPIRPRNVSKRFSILAERLGQPGMRFHDLRHTHATLLLTAGVPINAVAQRLGHSTPVITLKVYGHVLRRAEDQAVNVAGAMLAGALSPRELA